MIRLIVNADDLGSGRRRDLGIFRAHRCGIVTSASVLPNGPSTTRAVREALRAGLPLGVHLNLSEGKSLTGPISGFTDAAGHFPGKQPLRERLISTSGLDLAAVRQELHAQIDAIFQAGARPDHLDSHQHFHLFPPLASVVTSLATDYGIKAVRLPLPFSPSPNLPLSDPVLAREMLLYRKLAPGAAKLFAERNLAFPQGLLGADHLNTLDTLSLAELISTIPEGTWELMVHPGYPDPGSGDAFSGRQRQEEVKALTSKEVRDKTDTRRLCLIHFGDLPCEF